MLTTADDRSLTSKLMDHLEFKEDFPDFWMDSEKRIVQPLKSHFSSESILRAIGIISTNAHEIPNSSGIRGIFPIVSLLSHGCVRHSSLRFQPKYPFKAQCRANVDIKEGDSILISYVSPLMPDYSRKATLKEGWHFDCLCPRCLDPKELGALTSARLCKKCVTGAKIKIEDHWKCCNCDSSDKFDTNVVENNLESKWEKVVQEHDVEAESSKRTNKSCFPSSSGDDFLNQGVRGL